MALGDDKLSKMLCGLLGIDPAELTDAVSNLGSAAGWFKLKVENIEKLATENAAALKRIEHAIALNGGGGSTLLLTGRPDDPGSDHGDGGNAAVTGAGNAAV